MSEKTLELLNDTHHRDLRMHGVAVGHPHCVQLVIGEFARAAACCPLFFVKDPETGRFNVVALFGFESGELLVEGADRGNAPFVPLELVRQGFYTHGEHIAIDRDHPRFAADGRIRLFDDLGNPTDETQLIQRSIGLLVQGRPATDSFIEAMVRLRLVEQFNISLSFDDGKTLTLDGLYTISLDSLHALPDADIIRLFRNGYLDAAMTIQSSRQQIALLAHRRNERLVDA